LWEVSRYTKAAKQEKLAEQAMSKLSGITKQHSELSSTPALLDKAAAK